MSFSKIVKKWKWLLLAAVLIYIFFPIAAGMMKLGPDLNGPKIYNQSHHSPLYKFGFSLTSEDTPRVIMGGKRSWFYTLRSQ